MFRIVATATLVAFGSIGPVAHLTAQSAPTASAGQEAAALAEGWALLAQGDAAAAGALASNLLSRFPDRASVASLAVEAEIWRSGAEAGLAQYVQWLGARPNEEPALVRRLARAFLWEMATQGRPVAAEALGILAAGGDTEAGLTLANRAVAGSVADARALAIAGDERGVRQLIDTILPNLPPSLGTIEALGRSGHALALPVLLTQARSAEPAIRQAAMEALGHFDDPQALSALRTGLQDETGLVRGKAAAALYRLGNTAGLPLIDELASSESPAGRLAAARYLSTRPDARFLALVRSLTAPAQAPDIRLAAARLLAPHAPQEAAAVLRALGADTAVDLAVREEAVRAQALALPTDLAALRALLAEPDDAVRLASAERILLLTQ